MIVKTGLLVVMLGALALNSDGTSGAKSAAFSLHEGVRTERLFSRVMQRGLAAPYIVLDTLHSLAGNGSEGKYPTNAMIVGNDGHLYGTAGWNSASDYDGSFYKLVTTGSVYSPTVSFSI